jgi:hypothetical protein
LALRLEGPLMQWQPLLLVRWHQGLQRAFPQRRQQRRWVMWRLGLVRLPVLLQSQRLKQQQQQQRQGVTVWMAQGAAAGPLLQCSRRAACQHTVFPLAHMCQAWPAG